MSRTSTGRWQPSSCAASRSIDPPAEPLHSSRRKPATAWAFASEHVHAAEQFLRFASGAIAVPTPEVETWAMRLLDPGGHSEWSGMLEEAKPRNGSGDMGAARQLGRRMARQMRLHPGIRSADAVVPVRDASPKRPYCLPYILAEMIADILDVPFAPGLLRKAHPTAEAGALLSWSSTTSSRPTPR